MNQITLNITDEQTKKECKCNWSYTPFMQDKKCPKCGLTINFNV